MSEPTRILLVDDHRVLTAALRRLLAGLPGMVCAGEAASGEEAVALASKVHPDVVVMDLAMPGIGGIEATRRIVRASSSTRVVVLSGVVEPSTVEAAMAAGAAAFVDKTEGLDALVEAIRAQQGDAGEPPVAPRMPPPASVLSDRERQVVTRIAEGATMELVAEELGISPRTAETYRDRAKRKLGVRSVAELGAYAAAEGLVGGGDRATAAAPR